MGMTIMLLTHASLDSIILLLNTFGISRGNIRLQFTLNCLTISQKLQLKQSQS
jgi:hypothetical protein